MGKKGRFFSVSERPQFPYRFRSTLLTSTRFFFALERRYVVIQIAVMSDRKDKAPKPGRGGHSGPAKKEEAAKSSRGAGRNGESKDSAHTGDSSHRQSHHHHHKQQQQPQQNQQENGEKTQQPAQVSASYYRDLHTHAQAEVDTMTKWILFHCPELKENSSVDSLVNTYANKFHIPKSVLETMHGIRINGNHVRHSNVDPFPQELPYGKPSLHQYQDYAPKMACPHGETGKHSGCDAWHLNDAIPNGGVIGRKPHVAAVLECKNGAGCSHRHNCTKYHPGDPLPDGGIFSFRTAPASHSATSSSSSSSSSSSPFADGPYKKPCSKRSNCPNPGDCKYWHPGDTIPVGGLRIFNKDGTVAGPTSAECWFGDKCKRKGQGCRLWHDSDPLPAGGITPKTPPVSKETTLSSSPPSSSSSLVVSTHPSRANFPDGPSQTPCHKGLLCGKKQLCKRWHPGDTVPAGGVRPERAEGTPNPTAECRYDLNCGKRKQVPSKCTFWHSDDAFPSGGIVPKLAPGAFAEGRSPSHPNQRLSSSSSSSSATSPAPSTSSSHRAPPKSGTSTPKSGTPKLARGNGTPARASSPRVGRRAPIATKRAAAAAVRTSKPSTARKPTPSVVNPSPDDDDDDSGSEASDLSDISDLSDFSEVSDLSTHSAASTHSVASSIASSTPIKSFDQREQDRELSEYPIYYERGPLLAELEENCVLLIRSCAASFDIFQLPQYAAEHFGGVVLSIQSNIGNARYVASRIAMEYEGVPLKGAKLVHLHNSYSPQLPPTAEIVVITIADFLNMVSNVAWMDRFAVAMLYDCHSRLWQFDLALGILKFQQTNLQRKTPLRLVVSSAESDESLETFIGTDPFLFDLLPINLAIKHIDLHSKDDEANSRDESEDSAEALEKRITKEIVKHVILHLRSGTLGNCVVFCNGHIQSKRLLELFKELWDSPQIKNRKRPKDRNVRLAVVHSQLALPLINRALSTDGMKEDDRMVIFATNMAEYLVPLPEISLVIDTGMCKVDRAGVLVDSFIPYSTSILRQSLAGSSGTLHPESLCTYIGLFEPAVYSVEPSILYAKLDPICLLLLQLKISPLTFPLATAPDEAQLKATLAKLAQLGCIQKSGADGEFALTKRGEACIEFGFEDPRWASFVMEASDRYHQTEMACRIAALSNFPATYIKKAVISPNASASAPSQSTQDRSEFRSDVLFYLNGFEAWVAVPESLRPKLIADRGYDENVLKNLLQESERIEKVAKKFATVVPRIPVSSEVAVGRCLLFAFPDNIAEMLIPSSPSSGLYFPRIGESNGAWGKLARVSALFSTNAFSIPVPYMVVMRQKQLNDDVYIADLCHPIHIDWIEDPEIKAKVESKLLKFVTCFTRSNIHYHFHKGLQDQLKASEHSRVTFVTYDSTSLTLQVLCPQALQTTIAPLVSSLLSKIIQRQLDYETYVPIGNHGAMTLRGGLEIVDFDEDPTQSRRVSILAPSSITNATEFLNWCIDLSKCSPNEVAWHHFVPRNDPSDSQKTGDWRVSLIAFNSKHTAAVLRQQIAAAAAAAISATSPSSTESADLDDSVAKLIDDKRLVKMHSAQFTIVGSPSQVQEKLKKYGLPIDTAPSRVTGEPLRIMNVNPRDAGSVEPLLVPSFPSVSVLATPSKTVSGAVDLAISVSSKAEAEKCKELLEAQQILTSSVFDPATNSMAPVTYSVPRKDRLSIFNYSYPRLKDVEDLFVRVPDAYAFEEVYFHPRHFKLFAAIQDSFVATIRQNFNKLSEVKLIQRDERNAPKIYIKGKNAHQVRSAVDSLKAALMPISLPVGGHLWRMVYTEIANLRLQLKTKEAVLEIKQDKDGVALSATIFGPQRAQALAVTEINELAAQFVFAHLDISKFKAQLSPGAAGHRKLVEIFKQYKDSPVRYTIDWARSMLFVYNTLAPPQTAAQIQHRIERRTSRQTTRHPSSRPSTLPVRGTSRIAHALQSLTVSDPSPSAVDPSTIHKGAVAKVRELFRKLSSDYSNDSQVRITCVFCNKNDPDSIFKVCGHSHCRDCLAKQTSISLPPILCPLCATSIPVSNFDAMGNELPSAVTASVKLQLKQPLALINPVLLPFTLCPNSKCGALRKLPNTGSASTEDSNSYSECVECLISGCPRCGTVANALHAGRTCSAFTQHLTSMGSIQLLEDIFKAAEQFASNHFEAGIGRPIEWVRNTGLAQGCPAMTRFASGVKQKGGPGVLKQGFFAWHGTLAPYVSPICHSGFDPTKRGRVGQACGRGEYFGQAASTSLSYAGGSDLLIICFLLAVKETSTHGSFCYVVDNPIEQPITNSQTYCLPVLVTRFGNHTPSSQSLISSRFSFTSVPNRSKFTFDDPDQLASPSFIASSSSLSSSASGLVAIASSSSPSEEEESTLGVRWSWWWDNVPTGSLPPGVPAHYEKYTLVTSRQLESDYQQFMSGGPKRVTVTVIRYQGDRPQPYTVDFESMKQISTLNFERKIQREIIPVAPGKWMYMSQNGAWCPYDDLVSADIEKFWTAFRNGQRIAGATSTAAIVNIHISGRPEAYQLDFARSIQVNMESNTQRSIRRK
jgi:HrpA-like RNA helicase